MIHIYKVFFIFALLLISPCIKGQQTGNCVFDPASITDEFIKINPEVECYEWFEDTNEATILMKSGEYVYVKKWACVSYGMEAKKIVVTSLITNEDSFFWKKALLDFGRQFLDKGDYELYADVIKNTDWLKSNTLDVNSKYEIDIPHDNYPEFYTGIERNENMVIMSFYYYMN